MSVSREYLDFVLGQLGWAGSCTARPMFGGVGIYLDGTFCAIIAHDTLYLKADERTARDFEAKGMGPFKPFEDKPVVMRYYEVPPDVLEDPEELAIWARKALAAARLGNQKGRFGPRFP
ncbi:MAG TPA: TfoX/Sxy family protein [Deltaproteobacteria bacterium]|nr:TfoX/Sxy family protein [Deltaproteobacteria bacterium]